VVHRPLSIKKWNRRSKSQERAARSGSSAQESAYSKLLVVTFQLDWNLPTHADHRVLELLKELRRLLASSPTGSRGFQSEMESSLDFPSAKGCNLMYVGSPRLDSTVATFVGSSLATVTIPL
jgi:hypothetical protein